MIKNALCALAFIHQLSGFTVINAIALTLLQDLDLNSLS